VTDIGELKEWNFDGSSTGQAEGHDSDVFLRPAAIFRDPFRGGNNILVMAETCTCTRLATETGADSAQTTTTEPLTSTTTDTSAPRRWRPPRPTSPGYVMCARDTVDRD
jgi:glutamine synthetase